MRSRFTLTLLALLTFAGFAHGQGLVIIEPPPHPHRPPVLRDRLELRAHQVDVRIDDQVAVTTVEHVFYNPSPGRVEGHFMFPLPRGAQVDKVSMDVNGVDTDAELLDADKARRIYEDIVRRMRDPALLEYCDAGLIRARIFPIEPQSEKRITVTYTTLLRSTGGLVSYDYPLTRHAVEGAPVTKLAMRVELKTSRKLATIYSPSHEMQIQRKGERRAIVGLETSNAAERNVQLLFAAQSNDDDLAMTLLTYRDDADDAGYFMLLATPTPAEEASASVAPKTVVFVLDTSGSMQGEKLEQAKRALTFCVRNLNDRDRFQVIRFSTDVEPLFDGLTRADNAQRELAIDFIDGVRAIGGTAIHDALLEAQRAANDDDAVGASYIVFLTDGQPTIGETDHDAIVRALGKDAEGSRIFCFGIGTDINTKLLDRVAEATRAATEYVLPEEDLEVKLSLFYGKIDQPALANPKLHVAGDRVRLSKFQPAALPDLFHGEQLVLFGRYDGDGDATLTLTGERGDEREAFERGVTFEKHSTRHAFIPRMWATRRVGFLLDEIRLRGESDELRDEVVRLARRYGILTPYTSYLIVEDEARRDVPAARQTLRRLQERSELREAAAADYDDMRKADTGRGGIAANRANTSLRSVDSLSATVASPLPAAPAYQQASQVVRGRAFVQNGSRWIDTNVQQMARANVRRIAFASDDYFALLRDHPEAAAWLSVAQEVTFQLGDDVIEIVNE